MPKKVHRTRKSAGKAAKKIKTDSDGTTSSSSDLSDVYEVEAILNKRIFKGKVQYLITWEGFDSSYNSWEPVENIHPDLIEDFESVNEESYSSSDEEVLAKKVPQKLTPSKIHGLSKDKASLEEGSHNFSFLISFSDGSSKLVPREEANELCPQLVLGYYQSCISFTDEIEYFGSIKAERDSENSGLPVAETDSGDGGMPVAETDSGDSETPAVETGSGDRETPVAECFVPGDDEDEIMQEVSSTQDKDPFDGTVTLLSIKDEKAEAEKKEVDPPANKFVFEANHSEDCLISSSGQSL